MGFILSAPWPPSPLPDELPAVDFELSPSTDPHEGPQWVSTMRKVRAFSTRRGRSKELERQTAGKHSARLDNPERDFDPTHAGSIFAGGILPEKRARLTAKWAGVVYGLGAGYADGWPQLWGGATNRDPYVDLRFTDVLKLLGRADLPASWWDFVIDQDQPAHRWHLDAPAGSTTSQDTGFGEDLYSLTHAGAPTLGAASIVPYNGGRTATTFDVLQGAYTQGPIPVGVYTLDLVFKAPAVTASEGFLVYFGNADFSGNPHGVHLGASGSGVPGRLLINGVNVSAGARYDDDEAHLLTLAYDGTNLRSWVDGVELAPVAIGPITHTDGYIVFNFYAHSTLAEATLWHDANLADRVAEHYLAGFGAFGGERTDAMVGRMLDFVGFPAGERNLDVGAGRIGAYELDATTVSDYLVKVTATERGRLFVDSFGRVAFHSRHHDYLDERSTTIQATFGNDPGDLPFEDWTPSYDEDDVINAATITRKNGTPQRVVDTSSKRRFSLQGYEDSGLLLSNDREALGLARWIVGRNAEPRLRVRSIIVDPRADPDALWPVILGLEIGDRIAINITPQDVGDPITAELIVEGIAINASEPSASSRKVTVTLDTSPAQETQGLWILNVSRLGVDTVLAF